MGMVKSIKSGCRSSGSHTYVIESKGTWAFRIWLTADGKVERANLQTSPLQ
jgi:hypothetical protein